MDKEFKKGLKEYLDEPCDNPYYDPEGNSPHAVASRGIWREILWQYKDTPRHLKMTLSYFRGLETEIGTILVFPIYIVLLPVLPIYWGVGSYKRAIAEYEEDFKRKRS